jgi:hypothetical protein
VEITWTVRGNLGLIATLICLVVPRAALAEDVVVAEAVADDQGAGSLCIASSKISYDELAQLISSHLKIDGQVTSVDVTSGNAKVGFHSTPAQHVSGRFPSDLVTANALHQCAVPVIGAYVPAAAAGLAALGGIFGGLCWAGELGCGSSHGGAAPSPPPVPPNPPRPPRPPRPPFVIPTPQPQPPVSPFR